METLLDLARIIRLFVRPLVHQLAIAAPVVLLIQVSQRPGCSKEKAYITAMRSDLRQFAALQQERRSRGEPLVLTEVTGELSLTRGVELVALQAVPGGFDLRLAYPGGTPKQCWIEHRWGEDPVPRCDP